ncbi:MAG: HEAT repeat domain-containing protein [Candidatus Marinimicrobia bacterium]|nr:HEAT repeat domain-containing protein [Candidatus Neomarinimicrobiota bacterium]
MKCKKFQDILLNYDIAEIPSNIMEKMEEHKNECIDCSLLWEDEMFFSQNYENIPEPKLDEDRISKLHNGIMREVQREMIIGQPKEKFNFWSNRVVSQIASVAGTLVIGILVGKFLLQNSQEMNTKLTAQNVQEIINNDRLNNIKIREVSNATNDVSFDVSWSDGAKIEGNRCDPNIQKLLAFALVKSNNPGTRLHSAKIMEGISSGDNVVLDALIHSVTKDENPGVRLKALRALKNYNLNNKIRTTCIFVLQNESSPAIRMEAIQILGNDNNIEVQTALKSVAKNDDAEGVKAMIKKYYGDSGIQIKKK